VGTDENSFWGKKEIVTLKTWILQSKPLNIEGGFKANFSTIGTLYSNGHQAYEYAYDPWSSRNV